MTPEQVFVLEVLVVSGAVAIGVMLFILAAVMRLRNAIGVTV